MHHKHFFYLVANGTFLLVEQPVMQLVVSLSLAEQRQRQKVRHQELTAKEPNRPRHCDGAIGHFYNYCDSKTDLRYFYFDFLKDFLSTSRTSGNFSF